MIYRDIPFPSCIAFGMQREPTWNTTIIQSASGHETAVQNWSARRIWFDLSFAVRTASDYQLIADHHDMVRGRTYSFPLRDPLNSDVSQTQGVLLSSAGAAVSADGTYYLHRRYGSGANAFDKPITRPDNPAIVYRTRASVTTDITGAGAAITYTTGAVAITGHASGDTYAWAGSFVLPCRYDVDALPAAIIDREGSLGGELLVSCDSIRVGEVRE